jgi:hypothetical protein
MVLNLFLALLLNSFNCEELKSRKEVGHSRSHGPATQQRTAQSRLVQINAALTKFDLISGRGNGTAPMSV